MIIVEDGLREQWVIFIWTWLGEMCSGRGMSLSDRTESGEPRRVYVQARMVGGVALGAVGLGEGLSAYSRTKMYLVARQTKRFTVCKQLRRMLVDERRS